MTTEIKPELQAVAIKRLLRCKQELGKDTLTGKPAIKLRGLVGLKQWAAVDCLVNYFNYVVFREE